MTGKRIAGLAVGGLGLVGIGAGVYFGLEAKGLSDELSEPGAQFDPQKVADGDAAERNMYIAYGAGAALVITGAVLFAIGGRSEPSGIAIVPVVDRGRSGLVLVGDF